MHYEPEHLLATRCMYTAKRDQKSSEDEVQKMGARPPLLLPSQHSDHNTI